MGTGAVKKDTKKPPTPEPGRLGLETFHRTDVRTILSHGGAEQEERHQEIFCGTNSVCRLFKKIFLCLSYGIIYFSTGFGE